MNRQTSLVALILVLSMNVKTSHEFDESSEETSSEVLSGTSAEIVQNEISCESIIEGQWGGDVVANLRTCWISKQTSIKTLGVRIATQSEDISTEPTEALMFSNNKKIFFLPFDLDKSFNSLVAYSARNCSLKAIEKRNFKNLDDLQLLWLDENSIETVPGDTFEDLKSLTWLDLSKNRINSINGEAFRFLLKLDQVSLLENKCISKSFMGRLQLARLRRVVDENCSFNVQTNCQHDQKNFEDLFKEQTKSLVSIINKSFGEKEKLQNEVNRLTAENYQQKIRLGSLNAKLTAAQAQTNILKDIYKKIEAQLKENEKIETLQENMEFKQKENYRLLDENQKLSVSIKEKDERITFLQKKLIELSN